MKRDKKFIAVIAFMCVSILPMAIVLQSALTLQTPGTTLFVDPPLVVRQTLVVGERFSVNISVADVADLKNYEFKLSFNTVMLDVVGIMLLPDANLPIGSWWVSDPLGIVWINVTYDGASITTSSPVAVANIQFKTMNRGQGALHLYDTALSDSLGNAIPHTTEDGWVEILLHDVAIVSVVPTTTETYTGYVVNVTVVAKNNGDVEENFTVKVYHNNTMFGTFDVVNLASGANTTVMFPWNTSDVPAGNVYELKGEATSVPYETNLANNALSGGTVKVKIIGDVDGDNIVNIEDWIAFDAAWGTHEGDPSWNPQADINGDGVVDNADGVLIAQNYHNTA
jgi:hypothetical protein